MSVSVEEELDAGANGHDSPDAAIRYELRLCTEAIKQLTSKIEKLTETAVLRGETLTYKGLFYFVVILLVAVTGVKGSDVLLELIRHWIGS